MIHQLPSLIVIIPFLSAFIVSAAGLINKRYCFPLAVAALAGSVISTVMLAIHIIDHKVIHYMFAGWAPPIGISYTIDSLNSMVLVLIAGIAFINIIATRRQVETDFPERQAHFYSLYLLFITGLSGIVATGDAFNLYVLLEIASLTGYALIGLGRERAPLSGLNYLFMGTIGASFYLLGVGYLYLATGTLNMADITSRLSNSGYPNIVLFAFIFCIMGVMLKMAFFPLHGWLPNAYTYAPSASSSLIAPLTTKVMIYVMIRISLDVFSPDFIFKSLTVNDFIIWLAVIAIVACSFFALAQKTLKKMLTYVVLAEVGYMVGGFWLGNHEGITGAILHIINDGVMTFTVFLFAGIVMFKLKGDTFIHIQGLFKKMPFSMAAFVIGALSIIGVPPTCGFFSKWYLVLGAINSGHYEFLIALLFSSLVSVVLFFRIIEICYYEPFPDNHDHEDKSSAHSHDIDPKLDEAPLDILVPFMTVAVSLLILGLCSGYIVTNFIEKYLSMRLL